MSDQKYISRKNFFKSSLGYLFDAVREAGNASVELYAEKPGIFRPPGALPEKEFLEKCTRCDACVKICPKESIMKFIGQNSVNHLTPVINFRKSACVLCDEFPCINSCESGALIMPETKEDVTIGTAQINRELCFAWQSQICEYCINICPLQEIAIKQDDNGRPLVVEEKCTGCGLCEYICPVRQPAIVIQSRKADYRNR